MSMKNIPISPTTRIRRRMRRPVRVSHGQGGRFLKWHCILSIFMWGANWMSFRATTTTEMSSTKSGNGFGRNWICRPPTILFFDIPVACAAYTRNRPTKELDLEAHRSGSSNNNDSLQMQKDEKEMTLNQLLRKAGKKGLGGGIPGFIAGVVQVLCLMWVRTIVNYQCRYGTTFREAWVTLWRSGGVPRFYRGLWFALIQAPLSRFVSTASNDGVEALLKGLRATRDWGPGRSTLIASLVVGCMRIALMPVDTCKTVLQVDSLEGFRHLIRRVRTGNIGVLFQGSLAMAASAIVGHYPWFYTYNLLNKSAFVNSLISSALLRNAGIGITASFVSDTIVNSIRVIKTTKQSIGTKHAVGYVDTIRMILAADGWLGLFGRGLRTRLLANALQSLLFTVIWRGLAKHFSRKESSEDHNLQEDAPTRAS